MTTVRLHSGLLCLALTSLSGATSPPVQSGNRVESVTPSTRGTVPFFGTGFEDLDVLPAPLNGQVSTVTDYGGLPVWPDLTWSASAAPRAGILDLNSNPVAGNSSHVLRISRDPQPFISIVGAITDWEDATLVAEPGSPIVLSIDIYNESLEAGGHLVAFEKVDSPHGPSNSSLLEVLWGGEGDGEYGLPNGPLAGYFTYQDLDFTWPPGQYIPCRFQDRAPPGFAVGDPTPVALHVWHRLMVQIEHDFSYRVLIDYLDGSAPYQIDSGELLQSPQLGGFRLGGYFAAVVGGRMLADNLRAEGPLYIRPEPPALVCDYRDSLDTYYDGFEISDLLISRWSVPFASCGWVTPPRIVQTDTGYAGNKVLRKRTLSLNNCCISFARSELPSVTAASGSWKACVDLKTQPGSQTPYSVRLASSELEGITADSTVARVFLGLRSPPDRVYQPAVFLQINPGYSPIDLDGDLEINDPIIGVDVAPSSTIWNHGISHELCVEVRSDDSMTIYLDGESVFEGQSFGRHVDSIYFETQRNSLDPGESIDMDNLSLACFVCPDPNGDGVVNFADINLILSDFNTQGGVGDVDGDGLVGFADLNLVLSYYQARCD